MVIITILLLEAKKILVRHFRNGTELQPIAEEKNYDFNFQDFRRSSEGSVIMPDDQITVECTYDTRNRRRPLFVIHCIHFCCVHLMTFALPEGRTLYSRGDVFGFRDILPANEGHQKLFEWFDAANSYDPLRRGRSQEVLIS